MDKFKLIKEKLLPSLIEGKQDNLKSLINKFKLKKLK